MIPTVPSKAIADAVIETIANDHDYNTVYKIAKLVANGWGFIEPTTIYDYERGYERGCRAF